MAFERLSTELGFISKLPDEPNEALGLSAQQLKAEFDRAGETIKNYINTELLSALEGQNAAKSLGMSAVQGLTGAQTLQQAIELLEKQLKDASLGQLPDGSVNEAKLSDSAVSTQKLSPGAVSRDKLAEAAVGPGQLDAGAVGEAKIAEGAVTETKISDSAVSAAKLSEGAVTRAKLAYGAVDGDKLAPGAVNSSALASAAVETRHISPGAVSVCRRARAEKELWREEGEFLCQSLDLPGLSPQSEIILDVDCAQIPASDFEAVSDAWSNLVRAESSQDSIKLFALLKPFRAIPIKVLEVKK